MKEINGRQSRGYASAGACKRWYLQVRLTVACTSCLGAIRYHGGKMGARYHRKFIPINVRGSSHKGHRMLPSPE
jgi:hypothetical protein